MQQASKRQIVLIFCLLVLPAIFAPYHSDDYFQLLLLDQASAMQRHDGSLWGLFSFVDDVPEHRQQMQQYGVLPWFAAEDFYFRFWRPVAEISHWTDFRCFGLAALPAHIHSILWFLLLAGLVYQLARQTFPQESLLPKLAFAIFILDGQHVATIGWIANRNALIAAVFSALVLYAHMRWRESGKKPYLVPALLLLPLALLSSEAALAIVSYLFFYGAIMDKQGCRKGLAALLPYAAIVAVWFYYYHALGFGVNTSAGLYLSPFSDTREYLAAIFYRIPVYFMAGILPLPAGLSWIGGQQYAWVATLFIIIAFFVFVAFFRVFNNFLKQHKVALFWLLASLGALIPVCATLAQDRLALFQTIGMDITIAALICYLLHDNHVYTWNRYMVRVLVLVHLVLSPLHLFAGSLYMRYGAEHILANALGFEDEKITNKMVVIIKAPIGEAVSLAGIREVMGKSNPQYFLWLADDQMPLTLTVISKQELLVEKEAGFASGFESSFRSVEKDPFVPGQDIAIGMATIHIEHINSEHFPDRIRVRFSQSLNGDDVVFYTYQNGRYRPVDLPGIGMKVVF